MDPNTLWDELLTNMCILYELRRNPEAIAHDEDTEESVQENIACSLEDLAEWIRKGGAVPMFEEE